MLPFLTLTVTQIVSAVATRTLCLQTPTHNLHSIAPSVLWHHYKICARTYPHPQCYVSYETIPTIPACALNYKLCLREQPVYIQSLTANINCILALQQSACMKTTTFPAVHFHRGTATQQLTAMHFHRGTAIPVNTPVTSSPYNLLRCQHQAFLFNDCTLNQFVSGECSLKVQKTLTHTSLCCTSSVWAMWPNLQKCEVWSKITSRRKHTNYFVIWLSHTTTFYFPSQNPSTGGPKKRTTVLTPAMVCIGSECCHSTIAQITGKDCDWTHREFLARQLKN